MKKKLKLAISNKEWLEFAQNVKKINCYGKQISNYKDN